MKLKDLATVLRSRRGSVQMAVVYDVAGDHFLADGCSVEYAVNNYPDLTVVRITAYGDYIILDVLGKEN